MSEPERVWTSSDRHTSRIRSIDIAPDYSRIVTGSNDCKVKLWSIEDGSTVSTADAPSGCWVTVAAFSPDSTRVLAAGDSGCACTGAGERARAARRGGREGRRGPLSCAQG
jgi:WD40 repeat protein